MINCHVHETQWLLRLSETSLRRESSRSKIGISVVEGQFWFCIRAMCGVTPNTEFIPLFTCGSLKLRARPLSSDGDSVL
jgi:hypothetical protein